MKHLILSTGLLLAACFSACVDDFTPLEPQPMFSVAVDQQLLFSFSTTTTRNSTTVIPDSVADQTTLTQVTLSNIGPRNIRTVNYVVQLFDNEAQTLANSDTSDIFVGNRERIAINGHAGPETISNTYEAKTFSAGNVEVAVLELLHEGGSQQSTPLSGVYMGTARLQKGTITVGGLSTCMGWVDYLGRFRLRTSGGSDSLAILSGVLVYTTSSNIQTSECRASADIRTQGKLLKPATFTLDAAQLTVEVPVDSALAGVSADTLKITLIRQ